MVIEPHLNLTELFLQPGGEWTPDGRCWTVACMAEGFGYCLWLGSAQEMKTGDLMISGPNLEVTLRASQLGQARIDFFRVVPQRLNGLITVVEWRQLEGVAGQGIPRVIHFAASEAPARKFARLAALPERDSLPVRSALVQLWATCVGEVLHPVGGPAVHKKNLEAAFRRFIGKMSEQDLTSSTLADLAAQLNCSERHLSRLFRAEFGMSLREKQTELSLQRASQLLADPGITIRKVAHEMGFQHVGLFNSSFKKRFGVTPKEWRERQVVAVPDAGAKPRELTREAGGRVAAGGEGAA
jgi:AraC-like DNA-binding protein